MCCQSFISAPVFDAVPEIKFPYVTIIFVYTLYMFTNNFANNNFHVLKNILQNFFVSVTILSIWVLNANFPSIIYPRCFF